METLRAIFAVSAVGGICLSLMPRHSKMLPYIRFLLSLVLLMLLLSPLVTLLGHLRLQSPQKLFASYEEDDSGSFYADAVIAGAISRASVSLAALISAETGIAAEDMEISMTTDMTEKDGETEITVTAVTVTLYRREHVIAADKVRAAAERVLLCPCSVVWEVREDA